MRQEPPAKSRYDLTGAKSAVYRILPDGGNDLMWASPTVTAFSLYRTQSSNGVLIGTGDKGRIFSVTNDGRETSLFKPMRIRFRPSALIGDRLFATSSNQGTLYKIGPENVRRAIMIHQSSTQKPLQLGPDLVAVERRHTG